MCCKKVIATEEVSGSHQNEQGLLTEPVVHPEVGQNVPDQEVGPTEVLANLV